MIRSSDVNRSAVTSIRRDSRTCSTVRSPRSSVATSDARLRMPLERYVARDHQVSPVRLATANDNMRVRVVGVVVIDPHPGQAGVQVLLHPAHHLPHIGGQTRDVLTPFCGDDDAEVVPVLHPGRRLALGIHLVSGGVIEHAGLAVGAGAIAPKVGGVAGQTAPDLAGPVSADVGFDHHPLHPILNLSWSMRRAGCVP